MSYKLNRKLFNLAKILHKNNLKKYARLLISQMNDSQIQGPSVEIDPSIQADVQSAVDEIRSSDPNFFKGVSKIIGFTGSAFGQVSSEDPTVIHLNLSKIKQQVKQQLGTAYNPSNPKHDEVFKEAVKRSISDVISHEKGHIKDWNPEKHKFPGGEGVAESFEKSMSQKLKHDKPINLSSQQNPLIEKYAKSLKEFKAEVNQKIDGVTVGQQADILLKKYYASSTLFINQFLIRDLEISLRYKNLLSKKASLNDKDNILSSFKDFLDILNELENRYHTNLQNLDWFDNYIDLCEKYHSLANESLSLLFNRVKEIKQNIDSLKKELPEIKLMSIVEIDNKFKQMKKGDPQTRIYRDILKHKIPVENSVDNIAVLLLSDDMLLREMASKRSRELLSSEKSSSGSTSTRVLQKKGSVERFRQQLDFILNKNLSLSVGQYINQQMTIHQIYPQRKPNSFFLKRTKSYVKASQIENPSLQPDLQEIKAFLTVVEEIHSKYFNEELQDLDWFTTKFEELRAHLKEAKTSLKLIVSQMSQIERAINDVKELSLAYAEKSLSEMDIRLGVLNNNTPNKSLSDAVELNALTRLMIRKIKIETSIKELSPLLVSDSAYIRNYTNKRSNELLKTKTKQSQVGIENSIPGGRSESTVQYGVTGNDEGAPYSTRVQELLKLLEKAKK